MPARILIHALFICSFFLLTGDGWAAGYGRPELQIVAQIKERPGNIAVAPNGRIFISVHPFDNPIYKVMELLPDGTTKPYPNEKWAAAPSAGGVGLSAVIHLKVLKNLLYILDNGDKRTQPKLMAWDIEKNKLYRIWYLPAHVNTVQSFHQDFVLTPDGKSAFIADMGQADLAGKAEPALIYLNLETGEAARRIVDHDGVRPSGKPMVAAGAPLMLSKQGRQIPLHLALNPIAMDPKGEWVDFAPMGQGPLYKIRVSDLTNMTMEGDLLLSKAILIGQKPASDGMIADGFDNIFITSVVDGAIGVISNKGKYTTWIRDPLLSWPDGMDFGPDGGMYVTVNQLHLAAPFNGGEDKSTPPYMIVKITGGRPM